MLRGPPGRFLPLVAPPNVYDKMLCDNADARALLSDAPRAAKMASNAFCCALAVAGKSEGSPAMLLVAAAADDDDAAPVQRDFRLNVVVVVAMVAISAIPD